MTQTKGLRNSGLWCAALVLLVSVPVIGANDAPGWIKAGDHPNDYDMGIDRSVSLRGKSSGYIKNNKPDPGGFGTYMQMFDAEDFRGKRVQFSAFVRSENVENWAGLWMRVDGENKPIAFDNMQNRAIKGTQTWTRYAVVLDVDSAKARRIAIGVLLAGKGAVWIDDVRFETVGENVPVTEVKAPVPSGPRNLGFDK
jgi:hypothetical protein